MNRIEFIHGTNDKPVASEALKEALRSIENISGVCFFGFPLIATPDGKSTIDATLVSPEKGVVLFDLVEGKDLGDYVNRQDDLVNKIEAKLKLHKELVEKRRLLPPLNVVTFMGIPDQEFHEHQEDYPLADENTLENILAEFEWEDSDELYRKTLSAIESLSSLRKARSKREINNPESRGAKLKRLENSIATLDHRQNRAVIETVDGVQRIRGLAGSGKTIVLALKAAYLHTQNPKWRIAVTFNTRSLKGQFKRLITNFCIEQSGEEPDWTKLRIINAWGAPGGEDRDGIYYEFCRSAGVDYYDFYAAKNKFGGSDYAFDGACVNALSSVSKPPKLYDAILVDEAQDFAPSFLRLCYSILDEKKRLVYAYDELQNLSGVSVPPPEEIFGRDERGHPLVHLDENPRRDVILQVCYRNSRPVLVTAHALGFGIYRKPRGEDRTGLVQMFEYPRLWEEIGYRVKEGVLEKGRQVVLERPNDTSPRFLEEHSPVEDLLIFRKFEDETEQIDWIVEQIKTNIEQDELRHDDIVVIHPDPLSARSKLGPIRKRLFDMGIQNHMAGVDTDADVFYRTDTPSVVFTSIYRAKGNEAGMVYVVNAQDCEGYGAGLSSLRNRLFTAITRSKAWVRVVGYGPKMKRIEDEFERLKNNNFLLDFEYPTDELLKHLRVVHRDLSPHEKKKLESKKRQLSDVLSSLEKGELLPEDLEPGLRDKLIELLRGQR